MVMEAQSRQASASSNSTALPSLRLQVSLSWISTRSHSNPASSNGSPPGPNISRRTVEAAASIPRRTQPEGRERRKTISPGYSASVVGSTLKKSATFVRSTSMGKRPWRSPFGSMSGMLPPHAGVDHLLRRPTPSCIRASLDSSQLSPSGAEHRKTVAHSVSCGFPSKTDISPGWGERSPQDLLPIVAARREAASTAVAFPWAAALAYQAWASSRFAGIPIPFSRNRA